MECRQSIATQAAQEVDVELRPSVTKRVQFRDTKEQCSSGEETLSGVSFTLGPGLDDLSRETKSKRPRERILSRESSNIKNKSEDDDA